MSTLSTYCGALMDRETLVKCLDPALEYYNHTLTAQMWDFYFDELGGMKIPELENAVRLHMASLKSFPMTSHLRPARKAAIVGRERRSYDQHPDFARTHIDCLNMFEAKIVGRVFLNTETVYPINVAPVVAQATDYYHGHALKEFGDHVARSQCRSGIFHRLIKEFQNLSYDDDQGAGGSQN